MRPVMLLALLLIPFATAHAGEEHLSAAEGQAHLAAQGSINPIVYFANGMPGAGAIALLLWALTLLALFVLALPLLRRLFSFPEM